MKRPTSSETKLLIRKHLSNRAPDKARAVLHEAGNDNQDDPEIWLLAGNLEAACNNSNQAIKHYKKAIHLKPSYAEAYFYLAKTRISLGQNSIALSEMMQCLSLDENFPNARENIGALYEKIGKTDLALQHLTRAIETNPSNEETLLRIAGIYRSEDDLEKSKYYYNRVLSLNNKAFQAAAALAIIYIHTGDIDSASATIMPFLTFKPVPNAIAFAFSEVCQFTGECNKAITLLEDILDRSEKSGGKPVRILFALAKLYDRTKNYEKAYKYAQLANNLRQASHSTLEYESTTKHLVKTWNVKFHKSLSSTRLSENNIQPVFIIGMPRSGTSLTEQILASHPSVFGAGELSTISDIKNLIPKHPDVRGNFPQCLSNASSDFLSSRAYEYLATIKSLSGGKYKVVTDKMPENFWDLGLINLLFPSARIIHCKRIPLDTCISCYFTNFRDGHDYTYNMTSLGRYYREYTKIMHHWKKTISIPMLDLNYEDLVSNPKETSRQLVSYCGLSWDEKCLSPHKNRRSVNTASFSQVRHKVYTSSAGRWKNYDKYIITLIEAIGDLHSIR